MGSTGVNADFHICQDEIKDVSFIDLAKGCSDLEMDSRCYDQETPSDLSISKKACCSNQHLFAKASFENVQVYETVQLNVVSVDYPILQETTSPFFKSTLPILDYGPPSWYTKTGIHIAFQQFLI